MSDTRTVHFKIDPALKAYLVYLESTNQEFSLDGYDRFAARFRRQVDGEHKSDEVRP
jgi:hypothetical protein